VLGAANVRPVLEGNARSASATLVATSAWADAGDGVGLLAASCVAEGGVGVADATVTGTYTNTTQRPVRIALEAAGGREAFGKDLAPGAATTLTVHDGLRLPAGQAAFVLATDVDGTTYETRVPAGEHQQASCYRPLWGTDTSAKTVNSAGTVSVVGTITNRSDESMSALMSVPVGGATLESVSRVVPPGGTVDLSVNTGRDRLAEGEVTFHLSRDGVDTDGDRPERPVVPAVNPTAPHGGAVIDPAVGAETLTAGACTFDAEQDRSVRTFDVMADNTASTLPVVFHVGGVARTVQPGESMKIEFPVVWGTQTVDLTAGDKKLITLDVPFESCAEVTWPTTEQMTVTTAAQCLEWRVQLAATVENRTGHEWLGVLVLENGGEGEVGAEKQVRPGSTVLDLVRDTPVTGAGNVTVRLTRELEGDSYTVERSFAVDGGLCVPGESCEPTSAATGAAAGGAGPEHGRQPPWLRQYEPCGERGADRA
jgi:hypothetical protein